MLDVQVLERAYTHVQTHTLSSSYRLVFSACFIAGLSEDEFGTLGEAEASDVNIMLAIRDALIIYLRVTCRLVVQLELWIIHR